MEFIKRLDESHTNQEFCAVPVKAGQVLAHDVDKQSQLVPALANGHLWRQAGIATHDSEPGEMVTVVIAGNVQYAPGTFEAGYVYVTSPKVPGLLIKHDDMGSVGYLSLVGYAVSDSVLEVINLQRRMPAQRVEHVYPSVILVPPGVIDPDLAREIVKKTGKG